MGGALRLSRALSGSLLSRLPASSSMLGLRAWPCAGPLGLALVAPELVDEPRLRERPTEVIALLSLFTSGTSMKTGEEGLAVALSSLIVHGVSVTPLMARYRHLRVLR